MSITIGKYYPEVTCAHCNKQYPTTNCNINGLDEKSAKLLNKDLKKLGINKNYPEKTHICPECCLFDLNYEDMKIYPKEVIKYMEWAKKQKLCTQCIHPWYDGMCDCGNSSKYKDKMDKISTLVNKTNEQKRNDEEIKRKIENEKYFKKVNKTTVENPEWVNELQNRMMNKMMNKIGVK